MRIMFCIELPDPGRGLAVRSVVCRNADPSGIDESDAGWKTLLNGCVRAMAC